MNTCCSFEIFTRKPWPSFCKDDKHHQLLKLPTWFQKSNKTYNWSCNRCNNELFTNDDVISQTQLSNSCLLSPRGEPWASTKWLAGSIAIDSPICSQWRGKALVSAADQDDLRWARTHETRQKLVGSWICGRSTCDHFIGMEWYMLMVQKSGDHQFLDSLSHYRGFSAVPGG